MSECGNRVDTRGTLGLHLDHGGTMPDYSNPTGTRVRATGRLGGWDNEECRGRPCDLTARTDDEGIIVGPFVIPGRGDEPAITIDLIRFDLRDGTVYVGACEGDHFQIIETP